MKRSPISRKLSALLVLAILAAACSNDSSLTNLARFRPAYHSSSIDYNATAQLAVDGIFETEPACWVEVCGNGGQPLSKREHDLVFDPRPWTSVTEEGPSAELSVRTHGFTEPVDRISLTWNARLPEGVRSAAYVAGLARLDENGSWETVHQAKGQFSGAPVTLEWDAAEEPAPEA